MMRRKETAAAETLANRGRKPEGLDSVERYRNKYPKHSAFKSEVARALRHSRLLCGNVAGKGK